MKEEAKPRITEDTGCSIDAGSLAKILHPRYRLYFHGEPRMYEDYSPDDNPTVTLHLTSVSVIDGDGEYYVDLPEGGLYVAADYEDLKPFMED